MWLLNIGNIEILFILQKSVILWWGIKVDYIDFQASLFLKDNSELGLILMIFHQTESLCEIWEAVDQIKN